MSSGTPGEVVEYGTFRVAKVNDQGVMKARQLLVRSDALMFLAADKPASPLNLPTMAPPLIKRLIPVPHVRKISISKAECAIGLSILGEHGAKFHLPSSEHLAKAAKALTAAADSTRCEIEVVDVPGRLQELNLVKSPTYPTPVSKLTVRQRSGKITTSVSVAAAVGVTVGLWDAAMPMPPTALSTARLPVLLRHALKGEHVTMIGNVFIQNNATMKLEPRVLVFTLNRMLVFPTDADTLLRHESFCRFHAVFVDEKGSLHILFTENCSSEMVLSFPPSAKPSTNTSNDMTRIAAVLISYAGRQGHSVRPTKAQAITDSATSPRALSPTRSAGSMPNSSFRSDTQHPGLEQRPSGGSLMNFGVRVRPISDIMDYNNIPPALSKYKTDNAVLVRRIRRFTSKGKWEPRVAVVLGHPMERVAICDEKAMVRRSVQWAFITGFELLKAHDMKVLVVSIAEERDLVIRSYHEDESLPVSDIVSIILDEFPEIENTQHSKVANLKGALSGRNLKKVPGQQSPRDDAQGGTPQSPAGSPPGTPRSRQRRRKEIMDAMAASSPGGASPLPGVPMLDSPRGSTLTSHTLQDLEANGGTPRAGQKNQPQPAPAPQQTVRDQAKPVSSVPNGTNHREGAAKQQDPPQDASTPNAEGSSHSAAVPARAPAAAAAPAAAKEGRTCVRATDETSEPDVGEPTPTNAAATKSRTQRHQDPQLGDKTPSPPGSVTSSDRLGGSMRKRNSFDGVISAKAPPQETNTVSPVVTAAKQSAPPPAVPPLQTAPTPPAPAPLPTPSPNAAVASAPYRTPERQINGTAQLEEFASPYANVVVPENVRCSIRGRCDGVFKIVCDDRLMRQLLTLRIDDDGSSPGVVVCISDVVPCALAIPQAKFLQALEDAVHNGWLLPAAGGGSGGKGASSAPVIEARDHDFMWSSIDAARFVQRWRSGATPVLQASGGS